MGRKKQAAFRHIVPATFSYDAIIKRDHDAAIEINLKQKKSLKILAKKASSVRISDIDRNEAIDRLKRAGILDNNGNLAKPYVRKKA